MLYQLYETQRSLMEPFSDLAQTAAKIYSNPLSMMGQSPFAQRISAGSDLMKIVFKIKEDDARNPGVIADCVGDNAGDSVGPSADGFETP